MTTIGGIPYIEAEFDKRGALARPVTAPPPGVTDLFVLSHGWNNTADEARALYRRLFESLTAIARPAEMPGRSFAVLGIIWPSQKFDALVAVSDADAAGGAAGVAGPDARSRQTVEARLDAMKAVFSEPEQVRTLDEAKALVKDIDDKSSARRAFVDKMRSLLDPSAANRDDASDTFFADDGNELMKNLKVAEEDVDDAIIAAGGALSLPSGVGVATASPGGAVGLIDRLAGFAAAAVNLLNYTTYYEMKTRAGVVGATGLAPLLDRLAPPVQRLHLVGHSFGGRVVTAAAANSHTGAIASLTLLQAAFSHNGFSKRKSGFFRAVIDGTRVRGPILITHTKNDRAVGLAYPLASRISGDKTAAFGDENDVFGGLGRNGAQQMESGEVAVGKLLADSGSYTFQAGRIFNLEATDFITGHGDVAGRQVAHALWTAVTT